jgi:hypothetical protein
MPRTVIYRVGPRDLLGRYPVERIVHQSDGEGRITISERLVLTQVWREELAYRTARVLNRSLEVHQMMRGSFETFRSIEADICTAERAAPQRAAA